MHARRSSLTTRLLVLSATALVAAPLTACGTDTATDAEQAAGTDTITVDDAWVRASDQQMTGSFGVVSNTGDTDLTVVSATTDASDMTELHEVVMIDGEMKMQQKQGGFVVPAGGEHVLEPGGDHIMVMAMNEPIEPGDEVEITLTFDDGSTYTYTAQARQAEVGDEEYVPSDEMSDMEGEDG